jgi:LAO/AO transport system kinase
MSWRSRALQPDLHSRLAHRDRSAVAEALNLVDDTRPERRREALALLDALDSEAAFPGSARIGVTGAPGAGKSTLLDALVRALRRREQSVGVVAVDPSSRRTGGALLGDRIRMRSGGGDPGVFIRSMAARDRLGGVAESTRAAVTILATVFDCVFVETVGVGQSESEVSGLVDSLLFVANPGSGDTLQFMKAGILELPDVFAVNKADAGATAERTARELEAGLRALLEALDAHREHALASGALRARREEGRERFVIEALVQRYGSYGLATLGGVDGAREKLRTEPRDSPFGAIARLGRAIEDALGA